MQQSERVTILGLGNILLQDEGFGVHFTRWFGERYSLPDNVQIIDGGTLGFVLLDTVTSCERMLVIDCLKVDDDPGSIYRFNRQEMELKLPDPTSAHEVEFFDVLCSAELMDQLPEITFLCITPASYGEMILEMSPIMHERYPKMEELLLKELAAIGVHAEKKSDA